MLCTANANANSMMLQKVFFQTTGKTNPINPIMVAMVGIGVLIRYKKTNDTIGT